MTFKQAVKQLKLNDEQVAELQSIARRTWSAINSDVPAGVSAPKDVAEVVLDADYMKMYGRPATWSAPVQKALSYGSGNYEALLIVVAATFK